MRLKDLIEQIILIQNEGKYKKASEDYVKISGFTYNLICELIEFRNNIINPILFEVFYVYLVYQRRKEILYFGK